MLDLLDLDAEEAHLRTETGRTIPLDVERWLSWADEVDELVLDLAVGPVLDIGCGPGRHVAALARRHVTALGIDVAHRAIELARGRGALVLLQSVFDPLPAPGSWRTALLMDGSVGIGGDPVRLLRRAATAVRAGGHLLVELEAPEVVTESLLVSLGGATAPWFPWAVVSVADIADIARRSGYAHSTVFEVSGRWFAHLGRT